jgi:hypothetical protein
VRSPSLTANGTTVELVVKTSAQEATVARESTKTVVRDAENWATLAEREARERVLRVEVESASMLTSTHEKAEDLVWRITLLEGEVAEAHWDREVAEENSQGLSNATADAKR